jgi:MULE transposase domain
MPRPTCKLHPKSRVVRSGYYGAHNEFVRWLCKPGPGSKGKHYLNLTQRKEPLHVKMLGGAHAGCEECERDWNPTEGLPSADYDNFVLRRKAEALIQIGRGMSIREAGQLARIAAIEQRTGKAPPAHEVSRNGRMGGDWVPQYTEIIAAELLPRRWPRAIAIDSFDVRVRGFNEDGTPLLKGRFLYSVFGACGYEKESGRGQLWHLAAMDGETEQHWRRFFRQLEGAPEVIVWDGGKAIRNAAAWAFPDAKIYACTWHLQNTPKAHAKKHKLWNEKRRLYRVLRHDLFWSRENWERGKAVLERFLAADRSKASPHQRKGLHKIDRWLATNAEAIEQVLDEPHWPRDLKLLEEYLAQIRSRLGERKRNFRNRARLDCVLKLMLLDLRGQASAPSWTHILRDNHKPHDGSPPPRRLVDGKHTLVPRGKGLTPKEAQKVPAKSRR